MSASLFLYQDSFNCDTPQEFVDYLFESSKAHILARKNSDNFFKNIDIYYFNTKIGSIHELINTDGILNRDSRNALRFIIDSSANVDFPFTLVDDLDQHNPNENNGFFGLQFEGLNIPLNKSIFSENSWYEFHCVYGLKCNSEINVKNSLPIYFPNINYADRFVNSWHDVTEEIRHLNGGEKVAKIEEVGREVARRNFYLYDNHISQRNQKETGKKRVIFRIGSGNHKIFLSLDFENGGFEVCDYRGHHLGAYGFHGKLIKEADTTGKHNIIV
jgi:Fe-S cluster assembly iron-binding protein IscA